MRLAVSRAGVGMHDLVRHKREVLANDPVFDQP
jgi:hypothetical protein